MLFFDFRLVPHVMVRIGREPFPFSFDFIPEHNSFIIGKLWPG